MPSWVSRSFLGAFSRRSVNLRNSSRTPAATMRPRRSQELCREEGIPLKVEYTLTPDDIGAYVAHRGGRPQKSAFRRLLYLGAPVFSLLIFAFFTVADLLDKGAPWPVVAAFPLVAVLLVWFVFRIEKRLWTRVRDALARHQTVEVQPEGL